MCIEEEPRRMSWKWKLVVQLVVLVVVLVFALAALKISPEVALSGAFIVLVVGAGVKAARAFVTDHPLPRRYHPLPRRS